MNEPKKLWAMHVPGPDDVYAMESEEAARAAADAHNKAVEEVGLAKRFDLSPECVTARVIKWPYCAESHAESLASGEPDVLDVTNGAGIPDSLFLALTRK